MINVGVIGASGRMGRMLLQAVINHPQMQLCAAIVPADDNLLGVDAGALVGVAQCGVVLSHQLESVLPTANAMIDFTNADATMNHVELCRQYKTPLVIGTTGLDEHQKQTLSAAAQEFPIVFAPNMSVGVNVLWKLLQVAAQVLGDDADVEITEAHHRNKVDAPSGTALKMGEVIAQTLGRDLKQCAVYHREGITGPRARESIGFSTIRAGDTIGDHTALFACEGERIEITHKASNRDIYAKGALKAVLFLQDKPNGLFDMQDVLGLA